GGAAIELQEGDAAVGGGRQARQGQGRLDARGRQIRADLVERAAVDGGDQLAAGDRQALDIAAVQLGDARAVGSHVPDAIVGRGRALAAGPDGAAVAAGCPADGVLAEGRGAERAQAFHVGVEPHHGHGALGRRCRDAVGLGAAGGHGIAGNHQTQAVGRAVEQAFRALAAGRQRRCTA
ncbi:conserved hypothetical protein, partial [Ricinus communis]